MERFEIQPVLASDIPEAARFVHKQDRGPTGSGPAGNAFGEGPLGAERRVRWLLLDNPFSTGVSRHGFCIRDSSGAMRGLLLCFPSRFVAGDRYLMGLGSGGFFVEPPARTMGFYLFKKYLRTPGCSIFFATTCNENSAPLWKALGGCAVPYSELEYVLPLRLDTLLPALLAEKTSSGSALAAARMAGRCGDRILRFSRQRSTGVTIEPCRDWDKLSWLFHRYRPEDSITADRSPEFLAWRYGQNSNAHPAGVYLVRDRRGDEGWFSLGAATRRGRISGAILLDAIWPREKISFREILPAIVELVAGKFDVFSLRQQPGIGQECSRWAIRHRLAAGRYAIARDGNSRTTAAALDLCWADGDSALPISPFLRSEVGGARGELVQLSAGPPDCRAENRIAEGRPGLW